MDKEKKNIAFHQKLTEEDCVACHSDHRGVQAFRPIGQFSHNLLEPEIEKQCDSCHAQSRRRSASEDYRQLQFLPHATELDSGNFRSRQVFSLDRAHTTECTTCHIHDDYSNYTCYGCHEHSRPRSVRSMWKKVSSTMRTAQSAIAAVMKTKPSTSGTEKGGEGKQRQKSEKSYYREYGKRRKHDDDDD